MTPITITCPSCHATLRLTPRAPARVSAPDPLATLTLAAESAGRGVLVRLASAALSRHLGVRAFAERAPSLFTTAELSELAAVLASILAAGELSARSAVRQRAADPGASVELPAVPLLPPAEALALWEVAAPDIGVPRGWARAVERRALDLAVTTERAILDKVEAVIARALETGEGGGFDVQRILDDAGVSPRNPQYSDMVFRTNVMAAYTGGTEREILSPDLREFFPYWRYVAIRDDRSRPHHSARHGKLYPTDQPFSSVRGEGPEDVCNCRCVPAPVHRAELTTRQSAAFQRGSRRRTEPAE